MFRASFSQRVFVVGLLTALLAGGNALADRGGRGGGGGGGGRGGRRRSYGPNSDRQDRQDYEHYRFWEAKAIAYREALLLMKYHTVKPTIEHMIVELESLEKNAEEMKRRGRNNKNP